MKKLLGWIQEMLTAAALAEEGEVEAARRIVADASADDGPPRKIEPIRRPRAPRAAVAKGSGA